jgi:methyl-accepting chemotaxis protein
MAATPGPAEGLTIKALSTESECALPLGAIWHYTTEELYDQIKSRDIALVNQKKELDIVTRENGDLKETLSTALKMMKEAREEFTQLRKDYNTMRTHAICGTIQDAIKRIDEVLA